MCRAVMCLLLLGGIIGCSSEAPPSPPRTGKSKTPTAKTTVPKASAPDVTEYPIKLHVPCQVGERREFTLVGIRTKSAEGKAGPKDSFKGGERKEVYITGVIKTLAVNERGLETRIELLLDRFVFKDESGKLEPIFDPNTVLIGELGNKTTKFIKPGDDDLPAPLVAMLNDFFALHYRVEGPIEADVFGSDKKHKVGDAWPFHEANAIKMFQQLVPDPPPGKLTGGARLTRKGKSGTIDCLEFTYTLEMKLDRTLTAPKDMKGTSSSYLTTIREVIPVDYSTGPVRRQVSHETKARFEGIPGTDKDGVVLEVGSLDQTDVKVKYLGKVPDPTPPAKK